MTTRDFPARHVPLIKPDLWNPWPAIGLLCCALSGLVTITFIYSAIMVFGS